MLAVTYVWFAVILMIVCVYGYFWAWWRLLFCLLVYVVVLVVQLWWLLFTLIWVVRLLLGCSVLWVVAFGWVGLVVVVGDCGCCLCVFWFCLALQLIARLGGEFGLVNLDELLVGFSGYL